MAERKRRSRWARDDATNRALGDIGDRATTAQADMDQSALSPEPEDANPSQPPVTPEEEPSQGGGKSRSER